MNRWTPAVLFAMVCLTAAFAPWWVTAIQAGLAYLVEYLPEEA